MSGRVSVSSADFVHNFGYWLNEALHRPVSITHHGRERLVLAAPLNSDAGATADATAKTAVEKLRGDADQAIENHDGE